MLPSNRMSRGHIYAVDGLMDRETLGGKILHGKWKMKSSVQRAKTIMLKEKEDYVKFTKS